MSLVMDLFIWLVVESFVAFVFYATGWLLLKIVTFGQFSAELKDFASFRASQSKKANAICFVGLGFYILAIVVLALING